MPQGRRARTPTAKQFLEAFGGRIYKPLAKNVVTIPGVGWGGHPDSISHLSVRFELGAAKESVTVEISSDPWHGALSSTLVHLVFAFERLDARAFPS